MKKKTVKKRKSEKSLRQKIKDFMDANLSIESVPEVTDEEAKRMMFPDEDKNTEGRIIVESANGDQQYACDGAFASPCGESGEEPQYNGPVPLGFRTMLPQNIPLDGVVGKAIKHFAVRSFFLGFPQNAWAKQHVFVSKACDMPGDDAVSCGYDFRLDVPRGTKQSASKAAAEEMKAVFDGEEFNLDGAMRLFESNKRCYGGALAIPCFEDEVDMSAPLVDYSQLKGNRFLGWTVIDPYYLSPVFRENDRALNDPSYKFYLEPTAWNIYGTIGGNSGTNGKIRQVHRSWCLFRRHVILAAMYRPQYLFFGPSVPQMILERLYSAEVCANETSMLLRSKRTFVLETDLRRMIANPTYMEKFLKASSDNANNWGTRLVERGSNAKQMDSYLSECMPLTMAQYGILCAEIGIPAPKFMMAQLTGFANSGNYEIKLYADSIRKIHREDLIPLVKKTIAIQSACMTGKPVGATVEFGEVDIPTITEEAQILSDKAKAAKMLAESEAVKHMAKAKSAESHKTAMERAGGE